MEKAKTASPVNEEQMVHLVRNALLVAGQEMGDGDQWPVVKDTIYKIMKDWENLQTERRVDETMKPYVYEQIKKLEAGLDDCAPELRAQMEPKLKELREVFDAHFDDVDAASMMYNAKGEPEHIKRMRAILATMEENDDAS